MTTNIQIHQTEAVAPENQSFNALAKSKKKPKVIKWRQSKLAIQMNEQYLIENGSLLYSNAKSEKGSGSTQIKTETKDQFSLRSMSTNKLDQLDSPNKHKIQNLKKNQIEASNQKKAKTQKKLIKKSVIKKLQSLNIENKEYIICGKVQNDACCNLI